jgi:hypothetical protein
MIFLRKSKSKSKKQTSKLPKTRTAKRTARARIAEHFEEEQDAENAAEPIQPQDLENLLLNEGIFNYDPHCIRKKSNWTKTETKYAFDHPSFSPESLSDAIPSHSPKLAALLSNIAELDRADIREHGHPFKHFLFSDLKANPYGAKLLASALIANGFRLAYSAEPKPNITANTKKMYQKIELLENRTLATTAGQNFFLLASNSVYDQSISVAMKKRMLQTFNQRPENIHGDITRFIVMDSGFKEGIDLFDIKYIHLFEPSTVGSDQKQVIGRGTRTCGQKGLAFHPTRGWPLSVFVYDLSIPPPLQPMFLGAGSGIDLYLKSQHLDLKQLHFANALEETTIYGAVDYELNQPIHQFRLENEEPHTTPQTGGAGRRRLRIRTHLPVLRVDTTRTQSGFDQLREWIREKYSAFSWKNVQMENLCVESATPDPRTVLEYTPSQQFLRHYFTPVSPLKGLLLWWSVGTGKTCAAISTATGHFERQGYTILWVTRTTLKNDIWKNMFDQVCNETFRYQLESDPQFSIPAVQNKRMRLLSKSWRIRPMSYKQFSNLVSKQNAFYKTLVKLNGELDPLRKTLIVIDEAHKLYGGDDLSSLERPDMEAFQRSIHQSYAVSGTDSVRLMLMTATPITQNPLEIIQLVNLCKPLTEQLPTTFEPFADVFLDNRGDFTDVGRARYLDAISGHISYLNRERDARQFAQPTIFPVQVPIVDDLNEAKRFDRKLVRQFMNSNTLEWQSHIEAKNKQIEDDIGDIDPARFRFLKTEMCEDLENTSKKECEKIVNRNIQLLVGELRREAQSIKEEIKEMRTRIQEENRARQTELQGIARNREEFVEEYAQYKKTPLYTMKEECAVRVDTMSELAKQIHEHPKIAEYDQRIQQYKESLENWKAGIKERMKIYRARMKQLRELQKQDLNDLEAQVVKATIRDERKVYNETKKTTEKTIQESIQKVEKKRKKKFQTIRKTIKKMIVRTRQEERERKREEKELRKTMRQQDNLREDFQEGKVKDLVDKYNGRILEELTEWEEEQRRKQEEIRRKKEEKERAKQERENKRNTRKKRTR